MKKIKRFTASIVSMILAVFICISATPAPAYALPECHYDHCTFTGEDCYAPGSLEASYVDYLQGKWKCDTRIAKGGQLCGWWSNQVLQTVASRTQTKYYYGLLFNKKNFLNVCNGAKVGTKLVLGQAKWEDGSLSHAIVLLKVTSKEVWWADCNWNHDNVVHYRHGSVNDFINFYHYKSSKYSYLHFVKRVTKYRLYDEPVTVSTDAVNDGTARIAWTKTRGAKKYRIYRSNTKNSPLELLAATTDCAYKDTDTKPGHTYYYKVKAVRRSRSTSSGSLVYTKTRLDRPHARIRFKKGHNKGRLEWNKVEGAKAYVVYRKYGEYGSWQKMETVRSTSYTDSALVRTTAHTYYWYTVRAIKGGNSKANSLCSPWVTPTRYAWVP